MSTPMQTKYIQLFKDTLENYISGINTIIDFDGEDIEKCNQIYDNALAEFAENAKKIKEVKTRGKAEKKTKDSNAPKGSRNAYIFFCMEARPEMKEENPEMPPKELTKELAKLYQEEKKAGSDRYQECVAKAAKDKARFSTEKEAYDSSTPSTSPTVSKPSSPKKSSKSSTSDGPKKPRNSYIIYLSKIRDTVTEVTGRERTTLMTKMYKEAKTENTELYQQCVKEYEEEKQAYLQAQGSDEEHAPVHITPTNGIVSESDDDASSKSDDASSESDDEESKEPPPKSKGKAKSKAKTPPPRKRKGNGKKAMAVA